MSTLRANFKLACIKVYMRKQNYIHYYFCGKSIQTTSVITGINICQDLTGNKILGIRVHPPTFETIHPNPLTTM